MHVEIRSANVRLPRAHALGMADRIRAQFNLLSHRIARIVVRMGEASQLRGTSRECIIEVHLPEGEVMVVRERQRRLGVLIRRATERAWKLAAAALGAPSGERRVPQPARVGQRIA